MRSSVLIPPSTMYAYNATPKPIFLKSVSLFCTTIPPNSYSSLGNMLYRNVFVCGAFFCRCVSYSTICPPIFHGLIKKKKKKVKWNKIYPTRLHIYFTVNPICQLISARYVYIITLKKGFLAKELFYTYRLCVVFWIWSFSKEKFAIIYYCFLVFARTYRKEYRPQKELKTIKWDFEDYSWQVLFQDCEPE